MLYAAAASGWRQLAGAMMVDVGVDLAGLSAGRLLDVVETLLRRDAAADDDPLRRERRLAALDPARLDGDGPGGWGTIDAAQAAAIVAADNRQGQA